jgi:hypothetical protein
MGVGFKDLAGGLGGKWCDGDVDHLEQELALENEGRKNTIHGRFSQRPVRPQTSDLLIAICQKRG